MERRRKRAFRRVASFAFTDLLAEGWTPVVELSLRRVEAGQDADRRLLVAERELLARVARDVTARSDGDAGVDVDGAKTREVTSRVIAPPF